jgi:hypothetical protein
MKHNKLLSLISLIFISLLLPFTIHAEKLDSHLQRGLDSIQPMDVYNYVKTLCLPQFAGRHTGHEGYTKAAKWAAGKFKEWGLKPISQKEGFLQAYPSPYVVIDKAEMTLHLIEKKSQIQGESSFKKVPLKPGNDFLPILYSDKGTHTAGVVFAGWGICAPELGYDDYAGLDVKGKFILCFRGTPDRRDNRFQKHDHHRFRMKTAKEKGALGLFYIYPEPIANPNGDWIEGFTPAIISEKATDMLLEERGIKSSDLRSDLSTYKKPISFPLQSKVSFMVESKHFPEGVGYNVAGYVEGSDPKLKKECLVVGGHFDHCGEHMGFLFAGANDNASGSAVVMEIAQAFASLKTKPKRSVVFVLFGGEEMGLMGSNYFANHFPPQFERIDSMFNFDMVGEGDGAGCAVSAEPKELKKVLEEADKHINTLRRAGLIRGVGVRSSDYAPFYLKGAACISFSSNGPHLSYHLPGDTIYRINPDIMADIAGLAFLAGYNWADR